MNISSMTGFASSEGANEKCTWGWEGKSVNAKGLDVRLKLPRGFDFLEPHIRKSANKNFKRGTIYRNLDISWAFFGRLDWITSNSKLFHKMVDCGCMSVSKSTFSTISIFSPSCGNNFKISSVLIPDKLGKFSIW